MAGWLPLLSRVLCAALLGLLLLLLALVAGCRVLVAGAARARGFACSAVTWALSWTVSPPSFFLAALLRRRPGAGTG